jgi:hypothetical protein
LPHVSHAIYNIGIHWDAVHGPLDHYMPQFANFVHISSTETTQNPTIYAFLQVWIANMRFRTLCGMEFAADFGNGHFGAFVTIQNIFREVMYSKPTL